ncbi:NHL repeat-containing protein [Paenibacillus camelliae]|uniref:NHL repeat-containing protein n=1 Tax=Paenibacillus camelliae TaxID=512410 RepID=UPI00203EABA4|nr:hypothetical protein [Paenibacillus camelliae]
MRIKLALVLALLLLLSSPVKGGTAYAEASYEAYVYNEWDQSKAAPVSYLPEASFTGVQLGIGALQEPQDLFVTQEGDIYIADTGNKRIVVLDKQLQQKKIIDKLTWNGAELELSLPTGLFVAEDGTLYIADKEAGRIIRLSGSLEVELVIEAPQSPLIADDFVFKPSKVAADNAGRIYVLSEGQFFGLMQFDDKGSFTSYYGSNRVEVTPAVVLETFWKNLLSKEQRDSMVKLLPIEYSNLHIGHDNFVYTTTIISQNSREEIKKLNPLGNNVLVTSQGAADFGDKEISYKNGVKQDSSFIDLAVDDDGFIIGLDRTRGKVFEYDAEGNAIAVFGSLGFQRGTFQQPVALSYWQGKIVVLDAGKRNLTFFKRSEYGNIVRQATVLYSQGLYDEAAELWEEVIRRNANNSIAYLGIAKALEKEERYDEALAYYKLGADRFGYSDTFGLKRMETVRSNLPLVMTILLVALAAFYGFKGLTIVRRMKRKEAARR